MRYAGLASGKFSVIVAALVYCLSAFPILANAQGTESQNAVCSSTSGCSTTVGSSGFFDASMFLPPNSTQATDICDALYGLFSGRRGFPAYPSTGAVVDARGISGTTNLTCTKGSPWTESTTTVNVPSTILFPPGTIVIPTTWVLPPNTKLIGVGDNIGSGTTIQAKASSFQTGTAMIQFGASSLCTSACTGISVENLNLDGHGQAIGGIANGFSQDLSYVDHVSLYQILGTGLSVSGNAKNSGPYSNITFDLGGASGSSLTHCASINGLTSTRGIRNLTCISESNDLPAAVLLDSSNNLLKDVSIAGFYDGILVGANAPAQSNVLVNIVGDTSTCQPVCPNPIRAIHISSNKTSGNNNVSDLSIMGVANDAPPGPYTISDDLTGTQITDPHVPA
jgi:hypothetical protein